VNAEKTVMTHVNSEKTVTMHVNNEKNVATHVNNDKIDSKHIGNEKSGIRRRRQRTKVLSTGPYWTLNPPNKPLIVTTTATALLAATRSASDLGASPWCVAYTRAGCF
jgi:hypothetical protein